jgi:hypothetical protein
VKLRKINSHMEATKGRKKEALGLNMGMLWNEGEKKEFFS